jgi:DNA-binding transcriptional MerR regulator
MVTQPGLRIGEAAARAGVSTRTLRYYEELGLLPPSTRTTGGARRYSETELERLAHIRELQDLMGFNLEEIRAIVATEDRLSALRAAYFAGEGDPGRQVEILDEALGLNTTLREQVEAKRAGLDRMLGELNGRRERYLEVREALVRGEEPPPARA